MSATVRRLDKPVRVVLAESAVQHQETEEAVLEYWERLLKRFPHFVNGTIFAFDSLRETESEIVVIVRRTDYARYRYIRDNGLAPPVSSLFVSSLIKTSGGRLLFGRMGPHTASPGVWQFAGGSLDEADLCGGEFDLVRAVKREIMEETGVDPDVFGHALRLTPKYLKQNGNTGIFYEVLLPLSAGDLEEIFARHTARLRRLGQQPEFTEIRFLPLHLLEQAPSLLPGGRIKPYLLPLSRLEIENSEPPR